MMRQGVNWRELCQYFAGFPHLQINESNVTDAIWGVKALGHGAFDRYWLLRAESTSSDYLPVSFTNSQMPILDLDAKFP